MQDQVTRAAAETAIAQHPSMTALPFTLAGLAWHADTAAATLLCDLGERAMTPTQPGRLTRAAHGAWHAWPAFLARHYARETWRGIPGPWPVKLALMGVCLAIPGPQDEILLLAVTQFCRARHARKAGAR